MIRRQMAEICFWLSWIWGLPIGFKGLDGLGGDLQWGITGGVFLFLLEAHYLSQLVGGWL